MTVTTAALIGAVWFAANALLLLALITGGSYCDRHTGNTRA